jgi:hypothetical protein
MEKIVKAAKKQNEPKHGFIANIPGCCDPKRPFHPIRPNECKTCAKHADVTCWTFFPARSEAHSKKVKNK